jgi:2-keto-4-pentenoate hydratase/2-oxohepta-3-ene-1,7-dioic acid hydratase in catechol pathway
MPRFCSHVIAGVPASAVVLADRLIDLRVMSRTLAYPFPGQLGELVRCGDFLDVAREVARFVRERPTEASTLAASGVPLSNAVFLPPYNDPPKIWCIGLNYREHAADLDEQSPDEPASFMRPAISIGGPGAPIRLPPQSERVTGEAELAVVIGRRCKNVSREEAHGVIAGFMPAIDMTAEDILRRNPRFLTRAKSFDSFLSLGPWIVTPDEIGGPQEVLGIRVSTLLNGASQRSNVGHRMMYDVYDLISFHSRVFTWQPGDILLTGTPGAVVIRDGDVIGAEVSSVGRLENPVELMQSAQ